MNTKDKFVIADLLATVIAAAIMLLLLPPKYNGLSYWVSFGCLVLSALAFMIPVLVKEPNDYMTRVPLFVILAINMAVQIVLNLLANLLDWNIVTIIELLLLLIVGGVAFGVSFHETSNDAANEAHVVDWENRFTPRRGGL